MLVGLVEALLPPSAPLMVMTPNNAVFDLLDEDRLVCLLSPQYVLMYHMAEGKILAEQLVNTLRDTQVLLPPGTVSRTLIINDDDVYCMFYCFMGWSLSLSMPFALSLPFITQNSHSSRNMGFYEKGLFGGVILVCCILLVAILTEY